MPGFLPGAKDKMFQYARSTLSGRSIKRVSREGGGALSLSPLRERGRGGGGSAKGARSVFPLYRMRNA